MWLEYVLLAPLLTLVVFYLYLQVALTVILVRLRRGNKRLGRQLLSVWLLPLIGVYALGIVVLEKYAETDDISLPAWARPLLLLFSDLPNWRSCENGEDSGLGVGHDD